MVDGLIAICIIWALLFSPFPLVVVVALLYPLYQFQTIHGFCYPSWQGAVSVNASGAIKYQQQVEHIHSLSLLFYWWFVSIKLANGRRYLIWRDSCQDSDYRQLMIVLKQWQQKGELNSFPKS
ncbi:protein YgfX [Vibrio vulnificus]|uniref:protein YgfX n=1 Tax=Vibrio vulnificus TaxID=672 RepID=UPI001CDB4C57|nr:protein YgfX [Vibrio vulnificus]MCA4022429.1 hypothetical protein [Vibrio vulnificus]HDY7960191.1 hypothetical protein [Vibrio vulnificus]